MVIKTELCQSTEYQIRTQISRVHSPVVKAADCRSAGLWFNSGWWTLFTFVTCYDKLTNHDFLMINIMSPITTSNRTITRKSVNMVAELDNGTVLWTLRGIGQRLECNSVVTKVLHAIVLKTPSRLEDYAVVDWIQWPGVPILAGGPAVDQMPGPVDHRHRRLEDDGGRYSKDTTQDCLETQAKFACFEAYNRSLSEELKARAKAVISEKTGDVEFRDNRSVLSSHGGLAGELIKSENSIELAQIASRVDSEIHGEISNGDDSFVKVKGFISDMNTSWKRRRPQMLLTRLLQMLKQWYTGQMG